MLQTWLTFQEVLGLSATTAEQALLSQPLASAPNFGNQPVGRNKFAQFISEMCRAFLGKVV